MKEKTLNLWEIAMIDQIKNQDETICLGFLDQI